MIFPRQVKIYSRTYSNCSLLAKQLSNGSSVRLTICRSAEEAVTDADIVCTTTFGGKTCLNDVSVLKRGVHINGRYC